MPRLQTHTTDDGTLLVRDPQTGWRRASPREVVASRAGGLESFGLGLRSGVAGMADLAGQVLNAQGGMPRSPSPNIDAAYRAAEDVSQFRPFEVGAGQALPAMALGGNPLSGLGGMAERVRARIAPAAERVAAGGIERTLGEATGSGIVRRLEAAAQSQGGFDFLQARRGKLLDDALAKSFGETGAADLGPAVRLQASERIGDKFEQVFGERRFSIPAAPAEGGGPSTLESIRTLPSLGAKAERLLARVDDAGGIDGKTLQNLRRELDRRRQLMLGNESRLADDYAQAIEELDGVISSQLGDEALALHTEARREWKNLVTVEGIPEVVASGHATARQANRAFAKAYGTTHTRGKVTGHAPTDEAMDMVRQLSALRAIPDSGTATRLAPFVTGGAVAGGGGDTEDILAAAAAGYLVPLAFGRASVGAARLLP